MHCYLVTTVTDSTQAAATEALTNGLDDPLVFRQSYEQRRDLVVAGLSKLGFEVATPEGAFYIFAKIPAAFGKNDEQFARDLANQAKVGVTPGSAFGAGGEGYIRLSYASSEADIRECLKRIGGFVNQSAK